MLLHIDAAAGAVRLIALLPGGRLVYPAGYVNAAAAQWLMACWPALLLARERRLPWGLRGALAGGAVLLAEVALLSQSRGSLYATPVMLVLVFALLPGRVRTFALLVPVAAGIGVAAPAVLRVGERVSALEGVTMRRLPTAPLRRSTRRGPAPRDGRGPRRRGGDAAQRARGRRGGCDGGGARASAHALAGCGGAGAQGRRRGRGRPCWWRCWRAAWRRSATR